MEEEQECRFIRLEADGSIVVDKHGREQTLCIKGIVTKQPLPAAYKEIINRLARMDRPLRCNIPDTPAGTPVRARVLCFGWQDKSGDVWLDLAEVLVAEGAAEAADE